MKRVVAIAFAMAVLAAVSACSKDETMPSFVALANRDSSKLLWKGGNKYEHVAYGNFAGNLELAKVTIEETGERVYEFRVLDSDPQKMPKGFVFKLKVPPDSTVIVPGGNIVLCDSCNSGGQHTFLFPAYVIERPPSAM